MADTTESATSEPSKAAASAGNKPTIAAKVYAPFQVYFEGEAYSISAVNAVGPFDILPGHRNFLCMLVPCDITITTPDKGQKTVKINRALMRVHANSVDVFVDV